MGHTKVNSEAVAQRCSVKKVFLEFLQNSWETYVLRVYFLIKFSISINCAPKARI